MALTNAQYDTIMRGYLDRRLRHEKEFNKKLADAYKRFPRLSEIDDEISSISLRKARISLGFSDNDDFDLEKAINELSSERAVLLEMSGFKDGITKPQYDCSICSDTGYSNGLKCRCFKQAEVDLLYSQSRLSDVLDKENFDTFSLEWYSDKQINKSTGLSARQTAKLAYDYARSFVNDFDENRGNICLYGKTGVGKTFLTHCIAKALMDKGKSVLYLTAFDMFRILEENTFHQNAETRENTRLIFECELLIIDDLGAGINNSFITSQLFNCINERMLTNKSTVISTNMSLSDLRDAYSDRVVSRITSGYQRLFLFGDDIRIAKKLNKGASNATV